MVVDRAPMSSEATEQVLEVPRAAAGARLDRFLVEQVSGFSRARLQSLLEEGHITLNGQNARASVKLKGGETIRILVPPVRASELVPEDIPLEILYEDGWLVVLNKPAGMVVHPARGADQGTLVHALLHQVEDLSGISGEERPGIVHRLDKDTSGVLVVAKSDEAHRQLSEQFKIHSITRRYRALVRGLPPERGTWHSSIGRSPHNRLKMASVKSGGKEAITHFQRLETLPGACLMEFTLETGRTHQIRVHTSEAGFPILCDGVYGGHWWRGLPDTPTLKQALGKANRQLLHARELGFVHPEDGRFLHFQQEIPADFQAVLDGLRAAARMGTHMALKASPTPEPPSTTSAATPSNAWDPLNDG